VLCTFLSLHFQIFNIYIFSTNTINTNKMVTTRSQTKGPMTRARAAAVTANITPAGTTTTATKSVRGRKAISKKKKTVRRAAAAQVAVAAAPVLSLISPVTVAAIAPAPLLPPPTDTAYVHRRLAQLATSDDAEQLAALRALLRDPDLNSFEQLFWQLRNFDAMLQANVEEHGQVVEEGGEDAAWAELVVQHWGRGQYLEQLTGVLWSTVDL
jgi:hypothetical protein